MESLEKHDTWKLVIPTPDANIIDSKWIFSEKLVDGKLKKKARLVARGYQQPSIEDEVYAPVARMVTLRVLLSLSIEKDLTIHQLDVRSAFLKSNLNEKVYMKPPEGLVNYKQGQVCELKKALYGLRQSPKCWNDCINDYILSLNFVRSKSDPCLYYTEFLFLLIWVDDILIFSSSYEEVNIVISKLSAKFHMKDLTKKNGKLRFLGIEIERQNNCIFISQRILIAKVLKYFNMMDCKISKIPVQPKLNLTKADETKNFKAPYKELIGSLMYVMLGTRPDLCYAVCYFSRYQNSYDEEHWQYLKNVLKYLKGTEKLGLTYYRSSTNVRIFAFVDSDYAGDANDRKSTTGFFLKINTNTVFWNSKKQSVVALSSTEAEYVALTSCATECLFLGHLLSDLILNDVYPIRIYEDNQSTIKTAHTYETKRSKHIDVKYHFIKDLVSSKKIEVEYISTENQVADILTKALCVNKFISFRDALNVN